MAAGLKSLETGNNNLGYVSAYGTEYAETCSGINAFALGVQAVNPDAVVHVNKISTWGDENLERQAAQALIDTYDCCVIGTGEEGKTQLKMCVVRTKNYAHDDEAALTEKIHEFGVQNLSKWSVPREIEYIDALPRTKIGKVDFKVLK